MEIPSYFTYIQSLFAVISVYILFKTRKENKKYINIPFRYRMLAAFIVILFMVTVVLLITQFEVRIGSIYYYFYMFLMLIWLISILYFFLTRTKIRK